MKTPRKLCPSIYGKGLEIAMNNAKKKYYEKGLKPKECDPSDWVLRWYLPIVSNKYGQG